MKLFKLIFLLSLTSCSDFFGSTSPNAGLNSKTQLQVRQIQTRDFPTDDHRLVMKAMLNVLQDDGFVVRNAVPDLGLLTAEKDLDVQDSTDAFLASLFFGESARWNRNAIIEATANVSEYGNQTRVRVTFKMKTLDNHGNFVDSKSIEEDRYYQEFFAKVDKGLFLQRENL